MNVHFTGRTNGEPKSKKFLKKRGVDGNTPWLHSPVQKHFKESSMQSPENAMDSTEKYCVFLVFTFHLIAMYQFHLPKCL